MRRVELKKSKREEKRKMSEQEKQKLKELCIKFRKTILLLLLLNYLFVHLFIR